MPKPPLPLNKVRKKIMHVRFTNDEFAIIQKFADKEGITISQLVKQSLVSHSKTYKKQISFDFPDYI